MSGHIRFLETNKSVCQAPRILGYDFVVVDYAEGESCQACLSLILVHNARHQQYDLLVTLPEKENYLIPSPRRELWLGMLLGASFCVFFLFFLRLFFNA